MDVLVCVLSPEKIFWCWTSSLKLWIMRRLSRRRPMKLLDFSVRFLQFHIYCEKKINKSDLRISILGGHPPCCIFRIVCSSLVLWGSLFELVKQAEHIFIIWCSCKGSCVCEVGAGWTFLTITLRFLREIQNSMWQQGGMVSRTIV